MELFNISIKDVEEKLQENKFFISQSVAKIKDAYTQVIAEDPETIINQQLAIVLKNFREAKKILVQESKDKSLKSASSLKPRLINDMKSFDRKAKDQIRALINNAEKDAVAAVKGQRVQLPLNKLQRIEKKEILLRYQTLLEGKFFDKLIRKIQRAFKRYSFRRSINKLIAHRSLIGKLFVKYSRKQVLEKIVKLISSIRKAQAFVRGYQTRLKYRKLKSIMHAVDKISKCGNLNSSRIALQKIRRQAQIKSKIFKRVLGLLKHSGIESAYLLAINKKKFRALFQEMGKFQIAKEFNSKLILAKSFFSWLKISCKFRFI